MVGEFKDDRIQKHQHYISIQNNGINLVTHGNGSDTGWHTTLSVTQNGSRLYASNQSMSYCRVGDTTRTKSKGVKFIIKTL